MNRKVITLILIFLVFLSVRLLFAFQVETFSDDNSYFSLRQVEHITSTGFPLYDDDLSYGGRIQLFCPLFYYILAFFNLFLPIIFVGKLVPNIIASTIIFPAYLLIHDVTRNQKLSLIMSSLVAAVPIFFSQTVNHISPMVLIFPLTIFMMHCFLNINKSHTYVKLFIVSILVMSLSHITSYVVISGLLAYLLLLKLEKVRQTKAETEIILFSVLFVFWTQFIIFKRAFLEYGPSILLQNIPEQVRIHMQQIVVLDILTLVGIIPLLGGMYIIYKYSFHEKKRPIYIILSFFIVIAVFIMTNLIPLAIGLVFAALLITVLFSQSAKLVLLFIERSKFSNLRKLVILLFSLGYAFTIIVPAFHFAAIEIENSHTSQEVEAMEFLKEKTPPDSVILTPYNLGHFLNYHAKRKNVADGNFLLIENINQRFEDIEEIYKTNFETEAINLLNKYSVDYIYISQRVKDFYGIQRVDYITDQNCFRLVFEKEDVQIFRSMCDLR
ncbi:MAG: hypothetical protein ACLFP2_03480 [Candidatus Woesearchaeota archaeon]